MKGFRVGVGVGTVVALAGAVHAAVNATLLRSPEHLPPEHGADSDEALDPRISVLMPARNEAAQIGPAVAALLGQSTELIVLDDCSTDDTAELARRAGARVLTGTPLPAGWLGKPWACAQLVSAADPGSDILVFVDADVRVKPGGVRMAVRTLRQHDLDIVCPFPRQLTGTPSERLVQPLLQWSWLTLLALRPAERSRRPSLTAACGQFVVARRDTLERAGGFTAVADAVLEDLALVRAVKAVGGRGGVVDGSQLAECRMYHGWASLRDGYTKSLWAAFGSDTGAVLAVTAAAVAWVLPAAAALRGSRVGLLGYAGGVASRAIAARRTGGRAWPDACAHPLSVSVFGYLTLRSVALRRRGVLRWKGRPIGAAG